MGIHLSKRLKSIKIRHRRSVLKGGMDPRDIKARSNQQGKGSKEERRGYHGGSKEEFAAPQDSQDDTSVVLKLRNALIKTNLQKGLFVVGLTLQEVSPQDFGNDSNLGAKVKLLPNDKGFKDTFTLGLVQLATNKIKHVVQVLTLWTGDIDLYMVGDTYARCLLASLILLLDNESKIHFDFSVVPEFKMGKYFGYVKNIAQLARKQFETSINVLESTESTEYDDYTESAKSAKSAESTESTEYDDYTESAISAKSAESTESAKSAEYAEYAESAKSAESTESAKSAESAESAIVTFRKVLTTKRFVDRVLVPLHNAGLLVREVSETDKDYKDVFQNSMLHRVFEFPRSFVLGLVDKTLLRVVATVQLTRNHLKSYDLYIKTNSDYERQGYMTILIAVTVLLLYEANKQARLRLDLVNSGSVNTFKKYLNLATSPVRYYDTHHVETFVDTARTQLANALRLRMLKISQVGEDKEE